MGKIASLLCKKFKNKCMWNWQWVVTNAASQCDFDESCTSSFGKSQSILPNLLSIKTYATKYIYLAKNLIVYIKIGCYMW
jgi:hypothetical protein